MLLWLLVACKEEPESVEEASCPAGEIADGAACVPARCGAGAWGGLEGDLYVDAAADEAGHGSSDAPFRSIQDAADAAAADGGGRVLVAAGAYGEALALETDHDGVQIVGRCADLVTLDAGGVDDEFAAVEIMGLDSDPPQIALAGLTLTGGANGGLWVRSAEVSLEGVVLAENTDIGLTALGDGAVLTLVDTTIRDTRPLADGSHGWGAYVEEGATFNAEGGEITGNTQVGVLVPGGQATLTGVTISGTLLDSEGTYGRGALVQSGGELTLSGCIIAENHDMGLAALDATLTVEDSAVLATQVEADGGDGMGIFAASGARLTVRRTLVMDNHSVGIGFADSGPAAVLEDVLIVDTRADNSGSGYGIDVEDGGSLRASGCVIRGSVEAGVYALGAGTSLTLEGCTIQDTASNAEGSQGYGLIAQGGAEVAIAGTRIVNNRYAGVGVTGEGTAVTLEDVAIEGTLPRDDGWWGLGLIVQEGASLSAEDCVIADNVLTGAAVTGAGSALSLTRCAVTSTQPSPDGRWGQGVAAQYGAILTVKDSLLEANHYVGLHVIAADAEVYDTQILDTRPNPYDTMGRAISVQQAGTLLLAGCTLGGSRDTALTASDGSAVIVTDSRIEGTRRDATSIFGAGVHLQLDAVLDGEGLTITGTEGPGIYAVAGSIARCEGCEISGNSFAGVLALAGARVELIGSEIAGNGPDASLGGGFGVYATSHDSETYGVPQIVLEDSTLSDHPYAGVWLNGPGSYWIVGNEISGGSGVEPVEGMRLHGDGLFATGQVAAWDGEAGLYVEGNTFAENAGVGVFLDGAAASLAGNAYFSNDLDLLQQRCDQTTPLDDPEGGTISLCPDSARLVDYVEFTSLLLEDAEVATE